MSTHAQAAATDALRALPAVAASRLRVLADAEGWPIIPGRTGHVEPVDAATLAVYTDRPKLVRKLLAVPGMRRWQMGDHEARLLFPVAGLGQVAALIGARRRRASSSAEHLSAHAYGATTRADKAPILIERARLPVPGRPDASVGAPRLEGP